MIRQRPSKLRQIAKSIPGLYWLAGLARYLRFRRDLRRANRSYASRETPTLPPPMLRYRVHGALDAASYAQAGRYIASQLVQCLATHAIALDDATLLDFACGPGRVAAQVKLLAPSCRLHGSDIDRDAIGWAQEHLRHAGKFEVNGPVPPTRYPGAFFDVAYSISLFTHLDEPSQDRWLEELARVLKPGGVLLATTHGKFALASCTEAELGELDRRGIVHRVDRKGRFKLDGLPDFYQTTFHTGEYVNRAWSRHFDVVDHIEGGLDRHQDIVLLKRGGLQGRATMGT